MNESPFRRLAPELLTHVLEWLPARELFGVRGVCRRWRQCVRDTFLHRAVRGQELIKLTRMPRDPSVCWLPDAIPAFEWAGGCGASIYLQSRWLVRNNHVVDFSTFAESAPHIRRKHMSVRISLAKDVNLSLLFDAPNLRRLSVGPTQGISGELPLRALMDSWNVVLPSVETLAIYVAPRDFGFLQWFPNLESLQLRFEGAMPEGELPRGIRVLGCQRVQSVGGADVYDLPVLESLTLKSTKVFPRMFRPARLRLETLDFVRCTFRTSVLTLQCPNVTALNLFRVTGFKKQFFHELKNLQDIHLSEGVYRLEPLSACRLVRVHLDLVPVSDFAFLDSSKDTLKELEVERVGDCQVNLHGFQVLEKLKMLRTSSPSLRDCPKLDSVHLTHMQIDSLVCLADVQETLVKVVLFHMPKLVSISSLMCAPQLKEVNLEQLPLLETVASLTTCPQLRTVHLRQLGGLRALALRSSDLKSLYLDALPRLGDSEISLPESLRILEVHSMRNLKTLQCLRGTPDLLILSVKHCVQIEDTRDVAGLRKLHTLNEHVATHLWLPNNMKTLTLHGCDADEEMSPAPFESLRTLHWCHTHVTSHLLNACTNLVYLDVNSGEGFQKPTTVSFQALGACVRLRRINVEGWCTLVHPEGAKQHPALEEIRLMNVINAERLVDYLVTCSRLRCADIRPKLPSHALQQLCMFLDAQCA